jgi:hypothetical protein
VVGRKTLPTWLFNDLEVRVAAIADSGTLLVIIFVFLVVVPLVITLLIFFLFVTQQADRDSGLIGYIILAGLLSIHAGIPGLLFYYRPVVTAILRKPDGYRIVDIDECLRGIPFNSLARIDLPDFTAVR